MRKVCSWCLVLPFSHPIDIIHEFYTFTSMTSFEKDDKKDERKGGTRGKINTVTAPMTVTGKKGI